MPENAALGWDAEETTVDGCAEAHVPAAVPVQDKYILRNSSLLS